MSPLASLDCDSFPEFLVFDEVESFEQYHLIFCGMFLSWDLPHVLLMIRLEFLIQGKENTRKSDIFHHIQQDFLLLMSSLITRLKLYLSEFSALKFTLVPTLAVLWGKVNMHRPHCPLCANLSSKGYLFIPVIRNSFA